MTDDIKSKKTKKTDWHSWAIGFAAWTIVGLSFASRSYFTAYRAGTAVNWEEVVSGYLIDFYIWGAVSPLIFRLARYFPIERGRAASRIALHFGISVIFIFLVTAVSILAYWFLGFTNETRYPTLGVLFKDLIISPLMLHQGLLVYWGTLIAAHAFEYYRQSQAGKTHAAELSTQLAQARLAALKMQIHPHFLFNTLNSIASMIHKDVEAADRMIARLSDFLRLTLQNSAAPTVTLEQELMFVKTYLEIEKIRFRERLFVEMKIMPDALAAQVPNLILQPLVENAVRHGVSRQTAAGYLLIEAKCDGERLSIKIEDNGPGLNGNDKPSKRTAKAGGLGLTNTRARLEKFYNDDFFFEVADKKDRNGVIVSLIVPYLK